MVIDDQPGVRRLIYEVLNQAGFNVTLATNANEALGRIAIDKPGLIILDMKMPGMSGVEFLKELQHKAQDLPVIVITAYSEMNINEEVRKLGVRYFLHKPFDISQLYRLVHQILRPKDAGRG
jgi:two-component system response regulator (stage 0 sporulation protein F)